MDFQQPHRYMRPPPPPPPPPSMADAHHLQPPRQPAPPPGPWFPGQFQYHHPPSHHSPSPPPPPPPHHPQWAPPHQSDHLPPPPYPPYQLHNQYPPLPPRPHVPPPLHPHAHIQQSYHHQVNQDWANPNQGNQGWEYPVHNNEEDWAARARAWAAAKSATDSLQPQSQFAPVVRQEEQSHYHDQYPQTVDPYYTDIPQPPRSSSSYQHYPPLTAPPHRLPVGHMHESAQSSYILDGHLPYTAGDRMLAGDTNAVFTNQESAHTSPAVHQQEVPSSYSSVTGREEAGDQSDKFYKSLALPMASTQGQYHVQPPVPAVGRSLSMEQSHYMFGNQSAEPTADLSDQPLDFAPRFSRGHDPHMQLNYTNIDSGGPIRGVDPVAPIASTHTWNPSVAPGVVYPPTPSGPQHDPSLAAPSPVSGHSAPIFGRMPIGAPFGIGTGAAFHPTTAFPGDVYGVSSVSERPKKASVPNWLREEIIKKKTVITTSAPDHLEDESQSIEDEGVDRSVGKGDHGDSKSADSSRSTEEEDDDEDYVEATRTAAINQEIKRVLTEVLLKVTDELFDEIATKVLSEGDLSVEVDLSNVAANHKVSPSTPSVPTPKASAQVLIPSKPKDTDSEDVSGKSVFSSPGDVLGLASYASDDDDDDGIQNSSIPNPKEHAIHQQPISRIVSEDIQGVENGSSQADPIEHDKGHAESDPSSGSPIEPTIHHGALVGEFPNKVEIFDGNKKIDGSDASKSLTDSGVDVVMKTELPVVNDVAKNSVKDDSLDRESRDKPDKNDRRETRRSSSGKSFDKEVESGKNRTDERHSSKERVDSRKRSSRPDLKEDRKDRERDKRAGAKEDDRKKRAKDEKGDRSRTKHGSELSRQKRGRSSSVASKGRNGKDNSVVSDANLSSDEPSDDSKRKMHSKRRNLSPSPVRSRRRQVSRSPHSKHSQRRHSPYSSLETNRGRRSRSRSPVRRQR